MYLWFLQETVLRFRWKFNGLLLFDVNAIFDRKEILKL